MRIAVAGATGRVGHHVVDVVREQGHDAVAMSRASSVDLATAEGLADALAGVECVIDVASTPSPDQQEATDYFTAAARNLHGTGTRAGVQRIVAVSIIGTDRFTAGYGAAKAAHEQSLLAGPIPVRILRAAQFSEFVPQLVEWGTQGEVAYVQKMRIQPVAARAVAEALVELATGSAESSARIPEIAGPQEEQLVDLAGRLVARRGDSLRIEGVSNPDFPDLDLHEGGGLLPGSHATLAGPTFDEWLETQPRGATKGSVGGRR